MPAPDRSPLTGEGRAGPGRLGLLGLEPGLGLLAGWHLSRRKESVSSR